MRKDLPAYGDTPTQSNLKPGLYLGLFHGRSTPDEVVDDWGFAGPIIGPLEYVHTTYACDVKLKFVEPADFRRYFPNEKAISGYSVGPTYDLLAKMQDAPPFDSEKLMDLGYRQEVINRGYVRSVYEATETQLRVQGDLLVYEGEFFGDWTVFVVGNVMPTAKQIADEIGRAR